jgi:hypothetical protein
MKQNATKTTYDQNSFKMLTNSHKHLHMPTNIFQKCHSFVFFTENAFMLDFGFGFSGIVCKYG